MQRITLTLAFIQDVMCARKLIDGISESEAHDLGGVHLAGGEVRRVKLSNLSH
jgi:hypothetical protein